MKERGRRRVHSAPPSVECNLVSLYSSEQPSRTEQIRQTRLICPSPAPRGGMGRKGRDGKGREGEARLRIASVTVSDWIMIWMILRAPAGNVRPVISQSTLPSSTNQTCPGLFYILLHLSISSFSARDREFSKPQFTARNYQFPFPLTLWEDGGRGRGTTEPSRG